MRISRKIALRNVLSKPFRSVFTAALSALLAFAVFAGGFAVLSLRNGLESYRERLGADVAVVPAASKGHGSVDDVLLQGITGNYYFSAKDVKKIKETAGIAAATEQFFLTSAKAGCCSARVQIIGFDPETDFAVLPWIARSYSGEIGEGDVVAGADISVPGDGLITFYGETYRVAAQLEKTGTELDTAVYANRATVANMAKNAARLLETAPLQGVDPAAAVSAVLIRVEEGVDPETVADDINVHITKAEATPARGMISGVAKGLSGVSGIIGGLVAAVWVLSLAVLAAVFLLLTNERKKEFAVLRISGASPGDLLRVIGAEAAAVSGAGAAAGTALGVFISLLTAGDLRERLSLPVLSPGAGATLLLAALAVGFALLSGVGAAFVAVLRTAKRETGLLLREDT